VEHDVINHIHYDAPRRLLLLLLLLPSRSLLYTGTYGATANTGMKNTGLENT